MASYTKFYLTRLSAVFGALPLRGVWDNGPFGNWKLSPTKVGDGVPANITRTETSASVFKGNILTLVSPELAAQTISGTIDAVVGVSESDAAANFYWRLHVWILNPNGSSSDANLRGTLLSQYEEDTTNEWPTTQAGLGLQSPQTLTSVEIAEGDQLVIELGFIARNTSTTSFTGAVATGSVTDAPPSGTPLSDLTVGSTSVSTLAGYFVFSNPIALLDVPPNGTCATADLTAFSSLPTTIVVADTAGIPTDNVQPTGTGTTVGQGLYNPVWYDFIAPLTGTIRFESYPIDSDVLSAQAFYNTYVTAYTGTCGALTQVALGLGFNGFGGVFTLNVTASTDYKFRVAARFESGGRLKIHARYVSVPSNDNFANRIVIPSLPYTIQTDTSLATIEGSEQTPTIYSADIIHHSVWWEYTPASDQMVRLSAQPTPVSAQIMVWTGSAIGSLTQVYGAGWTNEVDNFFDWADPVLALTSGTSYKIQVTCHDLLLSLGHNRGGSSLIFSATDVTSTSPPNRTCATAVILTSPVVVSFLDAVDGQFDHLMSGQDPLDDNGKPLWYTWVSNITGLVAWKPSNNSDFTGDGVVAAAVYSGSCGSLTQLAENDHMSSTADNVTWSAVSGQTYLLQIISLGRIEFAPRMVITNGTAPPPPPTGTSFIDVAIGGHTRFQSVVPFQSELGNMWRIDGPNGNLLLSVRVYWYFVQFAFGLINKQFFRLVINLGGYDQSVHEPSRGSFVTAYIDNPWTDPFQGKSSLIDQLAYGPNVDPYRKWAMGVRTSTYNHATGEYASDGSAFLSVDGATLWSVSNVQIKTGRLNDKTNSNVNVWFPVLGDLDNVWIASKSIAPTSYSGTHEIPQHPNLVHFDGFDTGIDAANYPNGGHAGAPHYWAPFYRPCLFVEYEYNFNTSDAFEQTPPIWRETGVGGGGAASMQSQVEGLFRTLPLPVTTTPPPVIEVPTPCCESTAPQPAEKPRPAGSGIGVPPTNAGPLEEPESPVWIPVCIGGGVVPTQADLTDTESWV